MDKRRLFAVLLILVMLIGVLTFKVFWLQTASSIKASGGPIDLTRQSVLQREQRLQLDSGRGDFFDRNGIPLTGSSYPALLVFPVKIDDDKEGPDNRLAEILGTSLQAWRSFRKELQIPRFWSGREAAGSPAKLTPEMVKAIEDLKLDGLAVVPYERRYNTPFPAAQLIGYIGQNPERLKLEFAPMLQEGRLKPDSQIGASGLEKTFEPLLAGLGGTSISLYTDANSKPIPGIGYRLHSPDNPYYPLQVVTTLDSKIQEKLEKLADQSGLADGAIVVLDVKTADVVAMVSRPSYDPEHVQLSFTGWRNRALKEAVPGSIFKTVVAAAALEYGAASPDEHFVCKGALGKYHFTCWKKEGHGDLTFRQAFAESCNLVFGEVMQRLKPEQLEETANRMGIGLPAGWAGKLLKESSFEQLDGEDSGRIWADGTSRQDEGTRLQTAIGQRDVRMTPLQAANMVVTLLNGGKAREVRAVQQVRYKTGRVLASFPERALPSEGGISARTTAVLKQWMRDVVEYGTGTALQSAAWELAGKSGTAQAPEGSQDFYNQWFIGYGPAERPKYAVSVVSLKQKHSGPEAVRLFGQVMDVLAAGDKASVEK